MNISPAELERLALMAEECAEIIKEVNKIIRFGFESYNPNDPNKITNRTNLENEVFDLSYIINLMHDEKDINLLGLHAGMEKKKQKVKKYSKYQKI